MGRSLILDTNILITVERGSINLGDFIKRGDDVAIAGVTLAEYRLGIHLDPNPERQELRENTLTVMLQDIEVLDYTEETAFYHARLMASTRQEGSKRQAHDLIIAAHAVQTGRILVSHDAAARFGNLPGVRYLDVP